jgi:hypothetical protein
MKYLLAMLAGAALFAGGALLPVYATDGCGYDKWQDVIPCPTQTPKATPSATPKASPQPTPVPTQSPSPTPTVSPTASPRPTASPSPTPTQPPVATPVPDAEPPAPPVVISNDPHPNQCGPDPRVTFAPLQCPSHPPTVIYPHNGSAEGAFGDPILVLPPRELPKALPKAGS